MADSWVTKTSAPAARDFLHPLAVQVGGVLYVTGGFSTTFQTGTYAYNAATDTWTTKTAMPVALEHGAVAEAGGKMYAIRGSTGAHYEYDLNTTWTAKTALPGASREAFRAVGVDDVVYVFGGYTPVGSPDTYYDLVYSYDPTTNTWTAKTAMPRGLAFFSLAEIDGIVYISGGQYISGGVLTNNLNTYAYDTTANTWTTKTALPGAMTDGASGALNGRFVMYGGQTNEVLYVYNPATDSWATKTDGDEQNFAAGGVYNGKFYVLMGSELAAPHAKVQEYTPDWTEQALQEGWGMLI